MSNSSNGTETEQLDELLFADLILPLVVWTGLGIVEVILASLVLSAIIMYKSLHNLQFFLIANLMICDLASTFTVNFVVTGTIINSLVDSNSRGADCRLVDLLYFPFTTSFIMVTVIIFDRFITVVYPFRYRNIITNKVAVALVMTSWLIGFSLCSFALFSPDHQGQYTRNGLCHSTALLSRIIGIVFPNVVATFLAVIQIIYLAVKAHKLAREHQLRQSLSGERIRKIALSRRAICTLILLVGIAGVLGVIMPFILAATRLLVGNKTAAARIIQNGVIPFFGKMSTTAHSLLYGFHMTEIRKSILKMLKCQK